MRSITSSVAVALSFALFGAVATVNAETAANAATAANAETAANAATAVNAETAANAATAAGAAAGNAEAGGKTFIKCGVCHAVEKDVSKIGPSLYGVIGRKAGTLASYPNYSDQMKASGVVWDENTIAEFVKNPRTFIKNTRMLFIGLKNDQEIANLVAYLRSIK